jgi:hypothetical protein
MKTRDTFWLVALVALMLIGCGQSDDGSTTFSAGEAGEAESLSVDFSFGSIDAALDLKKIKTFRIRIYTSTPYSEDESPLFDSLKIHGCFKASGTDVRIQDLKAGDDRFVYYEGFGDDACADRVAVGIRGGIAIQKKSALQAEAETVSCTADDACEAAIHPDATCNCEKETDTAGKKLAYCKDNATSVCTVTAPTYIPLFEVGKFNKLPVPSEALKQAATQKSCEADADCAAIHPAASCNQELGYCTVEGLFPFSPSRARAFHTADVTGDGTIVFAGGFNRRRTNDDVFFAGAPFFEAYNPYTGLFETPAVQENWGGQNVALHRSSLLGDDRLVLTGGLSEMKLGYELSDELTLRWQIPHNYTSCPDGKCVNFSRNILSANLSAGSVVQGMLNTRLIFHRSGYVLRGADDYALITGGLTFSDAAQVAPFNQHILCTAADILADDPNMSCAVSQNADTFPPRYTHSEACLVGGTMGDPCDEYMTFGGVNEGEPPGEIFSSSADPFNTLLSFSDTTSLSKAHLSQLARVETDADEPAKLYSFGGVAGITTKNIQDNELLLIDFPKPEMQPAQINVNLNESNYSMTTAGLDLTALEDAGEVYRLFHTVSVLKGGRIMLTGGIGADNLPSKSVLFFEEPATHALTYIAKTSLREARFGHTATVIEHGLLKGAVLVVGGFNIADTETGAVQFAEGAEIYIPKQ